MAKKSQLSRLFAVSAIALAVVGVFSALPMVALAEGGFTTLAVDATSSGGSEPGSAEPADPLPASVEVGTPIISAVSVGGSSGGSHSSRLESILDELSLVLLAVSAEVSATTGGAPNPVGNLAISGEGSFQTAPTPLGNLAISAEVSAQTLAGGGPGPSGGLAISAEVSATTTGGGGPTGNLAISDEVSAKTDNGGGGGGGGSSGGGGGSSRRPQVTPLPAACPIYLTKYIKFGVANDPVEVVKLQRFLIDFEGHTNLVVSGFYDAATHAAVHAFQIKYFGDVLGPWGINYSTGYVFITTSLAINNIYCERSTANDLDLRNFYDHLRADLAAIGVDSDEFLAAPAAATSTATTTLPLSPEGWGDLFLAGAVGLVQFIGNWWWIILLILGLAWLLLFLFDWLDRRRGPPSPPENPRVIELPPPPDKPETFASADPADEEREIWIDSEEEEVFDENREGEAR